MTTGVYCIENIQSGKKYIGHSINIEKRWNEHKSALNTNRHENSRLQNAWNKYGEGVFIHTILSECEEEYLASEEHWWCVMTNVCNREYGYNIRPTHPYNKPTLSQDSRKKLSEAQKEVWKNDTQRSENQSKRMKGKQYGKGHIITPEDRIKINEGKKNAYYSPESRKSMGHMRDKTHTEETRKLLSEKGKGRPRTEKQLQSLIERNKENKYGKGRVKKIDELQKMQVYYNERRRSGYTSPLKNIPRSEDTKEKLREKLAKRVICYNQDGSIYKIFNSVYHTLKECEMKCSDIQLRRSLRSGKIYRNKYWKYENINN